MKLKTRALAALVLVFALSGTTAAGAPFWTESADNAPRLVNLPSLAPLVEKASPAVVSVYLVREGKNMLNQPVSQVVGGGSGFIITRDGYIITNHHVIKGGNRVKVVVGVKDKKILEGKVVGSDPDIDVALLKVEGENLPVLPLGNSDSLKVGDWVACIGSPLGFPHSFTVGVVSALGRNVRGNRYDEFIQTDASINSGNSGGPMINMKGEVVGINSMFIPPQFGQIGTGLGFSIPINLAKSVLTQIKETGKVVRAWLGIKFEKLTEEEAAKAGVAADSSVRVGQIAKGGPADRGGLAVGDIIIKVDGEPITSPAHLPNLISSQGVGKKLELTILRDGQTMTRTVTLVELPDAKEQGQLLFTGQVPPDPALGLGVRDTNEEEGGRGNGVVVTDVVTGSPGEANQVKPGDRIIKLNNAEIKDINDYQAAVMKLKPNSMTRLTVIRGGATITRVFRLQQW